jgi:hypothetical protein
MGWNIHQQSQCYSFFDCGTFSTIEVHSAYSVELSTSTVFRFASFSSANDLTIVSVSVCLLYDYDVFDLSPVAVRTRAIGRVFAVLILARSDCYSLLRAVVIPPKYGEKDYTSN